MLSSERLPHIFSPHKKKELRRALLHCVNFDAINGDILVSVDELEDRRAKSVAIKPELCVDHVEIVVDGVGDGELILGVHGSSFPFLLYDYIVHHSSLIVKRSTNPTQRKKGPCGP